MTTQRRILDDAPPDGWQRPIVRAELTVTWGEELYAPVQYHSFRVGDLSLKFNVEAGETIEQAHERALGILRSLAAKQYVAQRDAFLANFRDLAAKKGAR